MIDFLQQNAAILIAACAVILSAFANWRVVLAEKEVKNLKKIMRRSDILTEIERKNVAADKLTLVISQKILLLQAYPKLLGDSDKEIVRLKKNLLVLQKNKSGEEEQRRISEEVDGGDDIELHVKALTDIRRLRINLESDVEKESNIYAELLEGSRGIHAHKTP